MRRRRILLATCPLLAVIQVYRRGYIAPLIYGCRQWGRATWRTQDEVIA